MKDNVIEILNRVTQKQIDNEEGLLDRGVLDSLLTMQLIAQLESEFSISIDGDDFTHYNFNSVDAISAMVEKYQS